MIKLQLVQNSDKYCNFCDRFRDNGSKLDVDFYELRNGNRTGTVVVQMCEFCVRDLQPQVERIDD